MTSSNAGRSHSSMPQSLSEHRGFGTSEPLRPAPRGAKHGAARLEPSPPTATATTSPRQKLSGLRPEPNPSTPTLHKQPRPFDVPNASPPRSTETPSTTQAEPRKGLPEPVALAI